MGKKFNNVVKWVGKKVKLSENHTPGFVGQSVLILERNILVSKSSKLDVPLLECLFRANRKLSRFVCTKDLDWV